jgi:hypothetical protein
VIRQEQWSRIQQFRWMASGRIQSLMAGIAGRAIGCLYENQADYFLKGGSSLAGFCSQRIDKAY